MKTTQKLNFLAATLACALASTSAFGQELPTTGTIESPIGPFEIKNGYPTERTVTKLYDALDFQRATQAYLWALPLMAMTEWHRHRHLSRSLLARRHRHERGWLGGPVQAEVSEPAFAGQRLARRPQ